MTLNISETTRDRAIFIERQ